MTERSLRFLFSETLDSENWLPSSAVNVLKTPFNLEEILRACPKLYEEWKVAPFVIERRKNGRLYIKYVRLP